MGHDVSPGAWPLSFRTIVWCAGWPAGWLAGWMAWDWPWIGLVEYGRLLFGLLYLRSTIEYENSDSTWTAEQYGALC